MGAALERLPRRIPVIDIVDPLADRGRGGARLGEIDYEALLAEGDPGPRMAAPGGRVAGAGAALHVGDDGQSEGRRLLTTAARI